MFRCRRPRALNADARGLTSERAGSDRYRHDVPVIELFEAEKDHMLPLPGVRFDLGAIEEREGRQDRCRHDRREPVSGRPEMAFHAPAGRCAFEIELVGPRRRNDHHAGEDLGPFGEKTQVSGEPVTRDHRAKALHMGRKPDQERFPETVRALLDRMDARTRLICSTTSEPLPPTAGSPPRSKRWNRHQRGTDRRPRGDRHMCQTHPRGCGNRRRAGFSVTTIHEGGRMSFQQNRVAARRPRS